MSPKTDWGFSQEDNLLNRFSTLLQTYLNNSKTKCEASGCGGVRLCFRETQTMVVDIESGCGCGYSTALLKVVLLTRNSRATAAAQAKQRVRENSLAS